MIWFLLWLTSLAYAGSLNGVLREQGTGDPIQEATVNVGSLEVQTDRLGRFRFEDLVDEGTVLLRASAENYIPVERSIPMPVAASVTVHMVLRPPPVEIVVEAHIDSAHPSRQVLDRERVEKTPGTFNDPVRLIQSLPGVSVTPEYSPTAGALAIRGTTPGESRVLFDGVELPYLYHFQQYASVIHTRMLDELSLYPSGFGASFGESVGGIVDIQSREPKPERIHGGGSVNAIMAGGQVQIPLNQSSVSMSGRRSFMDVVESGNDQYTIWPAFWDYMGRYQKQATPSRRWNLTAIGAGDRYGRYAGDTEALDWVELQDNPELVFDRGFHGLVSQLKINEGSWTSHMVLGWVRDNWSARLASANQERIEDALTVRNESTISLRDGIALNVGAEARAERVQRQAETDRAWPELAAEAPILVQGIPVDETLQGVQLGAWVEPRLLLGGLRIQPGLRFAGDTGTSEWGVEPRLISRLRIDERWRLAASAGRSSMAPDLDWRSPITGNPELGRAQSDQVSLGGERVIAERWEVGLEGWGRRVTGAVDVEGEGTPESVDGWAAGVEVTSRYRLRDRFFSWISLAFGHAERNGYLMSFDQPFALNVVASWDFKPGWNVGLRYRYASGLPFTPITGGTYDGNLDRYLPRLGGVNSERMPDYQKVDGHLERAFAFRNWTLSMYLEAWWVPPSANGLYSVYSYDYSQREMVVGPAFVPLVGARAEF